MVNDPLSSHLHISDADNPTNGRCTPGWYNTRASKRKKNPVGNHSAAFANMVQLTSAFIALAGAIAASANFGYGGFTDLVAFGDSYTDEGRRTCRTLPRFVILGA